jgi:putative membrane protein
VSSKELKFDRRPSRAELDVGKQDANALAVERTQLALLRSYQANERTLMAWVRTAISMISFGFTMAKFFEYLQEEKQQTFHIFGPAGVGVILILIGVVALVVAVVQHQQVLNDLGVRRWPEYWRLSVFVAIAVALLGVFALLAIRRSYS